MNMKFWKRKPPWFKMTVCIDDPSQGTLEAMRPPTNWLRGFEWWNELKAATPEKRQAMLVGAFIVNEIERSKS